MSAEITGIFVRLHEGVARGAHVETTQGLGPLALGDLAGVLDFALEERLALTSRVEVLTGDLAGAVEARDQALNELGALVASAGAMKAAHDEEIRDLQGQLVAALNDARIAQADADAAKVQAKADQAALAAVASERDRLSVELADAQARIPVAEPLTMDQIVADLIARGVING